jgi:ankyrin repeat protein
MPVRAFGRYVVLLAIAAVLASTGPVYGQDDDLERWELLGDSPENLAAIEQLEGTLFANQTGLFFAMNQSNIEAMNLFFQAGLDVNALIPTSDGENEFEVSVLQMYFDSFGSCENEGTLEFLKLLLEKGADPTRLDPFNGSTPLIQIAPNDCAEHTALLLEYGADPNVRNNSDMSALELAISFSQFEQLKALIEGGAKVDPGREELIKRASGSGRAEMRAYLEAVPERPSTLPEALKAWDLEATREILAGGASANEPVRDEPPLLYITGQCYDTNKKNHAEFITVLAAHGADTGVTASATQDTPLAEAVQRCSIEVVQALLDAGADPNATNVAGQTPLLSAVMAGNAPVVEALMDAGAKPDKTTKFMAKSKPEIKKLLKKR